MLSTSRLSLNYPEEGDGETNYPAVSVQQMDTLDDAVLVTEGTISARPAANTFEKDHVYKATDTKQWFMSDGTNWFTVMIAGPWVNLTLESGITTTVGAYTPAARLVGDKVELRGAITNTNGTAALFVAVLPSGMRPAELCMFPAMVSSGGGVLAVFAASSGDLTFDSPFLPTTATAYLDGASFSLS